MTKKVIGYYQFDAENFSVAIVLKEFWDKFGHLDDSGSEEELVPERFFEQSEAIYEHDFDTIEEAKAALNDAGWVEAVLF